MVDFSLAVFIFIPRLQQCHNPHDRESVELHPRPPPLNWSLDRQTLVLNFNTHFPLRGVRTIESYGFISSSHSPSLSGTPLHDSYFKINAEIANLISIITILNQFKLFPTSPYSLPKHTRGPYPNTMVQSSNFNWSSRLRPIHLSSER